MVTFNTAIQFTLHLAVIAAYVHIAYVILDYILLFQVVFIQWPLLLTLLRTRVVVARLVDVHRNTTLILLECIRLHLLNVPLSIKAVRLFQRIFVLVVECQHILKPFFNLVIFQDTVEHLQIRDDVFEALIPSPEYSPLL